jgi:hypothetical protein
VVGSGIIGERLSGRNVAVPKIRDEVRARVAGLIKAEGWSIHA